MDNIISSQQHLFEAGAIQIAKAMWGKSTDPSGVTRNVGGDMTKVLWVPGLSPADRRLLHSIEHSCRALPGTQEARRIMRFVAQAHRVLYGTPIVVFVFIG